MLLCSELPWAQLVKNPPAIWETWVQSLGEEDPLEKEMATHSVFLPGKFHGQRNSVGYSLWGRKEPDTTEHTHIYVYIHSNNAENYTP